MLALTVGVGVSVGVGLGVGVGVQRKHGLVCGDAALGAACALDERAKPLAATVISATAAAVHGSEFRIAFAKVPTLI